jgi:hypothetical protein
VDEKQAAERALLVAMMGVAEQDKMAATISAAADMTETERDEKRAELRDRRANIPPGENSSHFVQAFVLVITTLALLG